MLWYKGWLETRFRVLALLGCVLLSMGIAARSINSAPPSPQAMERRLNSSLLPLAFYLSIIPVILAGAGIKTQAPLQTRKGIHGSMYFTLSLPVTRVRLLLTRAGLGMLEAFGSIAVLCCVAWIIFPILRSHVTRSDLFAYWVTTSICASAFYCLSVLLATFLDDLWQIWGSMIVIGLLFWLSNAAPVPPSLNIFRAMGEASPLFTHTIPWVQMGIALGVGAVLFGIAAWVVQTHEY